MLLKTVIREFNEKISEQFGDNFKQLNETVGQLLVWQERYRQQMAEMIEQQQITSQNMARATEGYQKLMERAEAFDAVANSMGALIEGLDAQRRHLNNSLSSLATLISTATKGFPEIEKKIAEMVQQVGNGVRTANDEFRAALLAAVGQMSKQLGENITATNNELRTVLLSAAKQTSDSVEAAHHSVQLAGAGVKAASDRMKAIGEEMKASNDELKNVLLAAIQNSNREFNSHIDQMVQRMREQTVTLDTALQHQLSTSLESLGRQLAALSARFAADYTPLRRNCAASLRSCQGNNMQSTDNSLAPTTLSSHQEAQWISLSDLMTGLMMLFMLIAVAFMLKVQADEAKTKHIAEQYSQIRQELYDDLYAAFKDDLPVWNAVFTKNLILTFRGPEVLFDTGKADLKPRFKQILQDFFPRYVNIISLAKYKNSI